MHQHVVSTYISKLERYMVTLKLSCCVRIDCRSSATAGCLPCEGTLNTVFIFTMFLTSECTNPRHTLLPLTRPESIQFKQSIVLLSVLQSLSEETYSSSPNYFHVSMVKKYSSAYERELSIKPVIVG